MDRLDSYEEKNPELFKQVVDLIQKDFIPIIQRHAISGMSVINSENELFHNPCAIAMLIDIFSERGFFAIVDIHLEQVPESIDPKTYKINLRTKRVYRVRVNFSGSEIRRGER